MTHATPLVLKKSEMKAKVSGPRAETILMIRYFARAYETEPEQKGAVKKSLAN